MEQPPGTLDDLQPEDLSTSALPSVIDLTRKDEECVLGPASLTAMVQNPGWFQNSGPSNIGLPFSDTGPSNLHPAGHIQPDNAFSHTTVTLSYVSRAHVFSTESPSGHSSVYSLPSFSKYPLQPSCDLDKALDKTGITLNQQYSENIDGPMDLVAQTELLQSLPQDRLGLKTQLELNGAVQNVESHLDTRPEHSMDNSENMQNGEVNFWVCRKSLQQCPKSLDSTESLQDNVQAYSNSLCKSPQSFSEYSNSLPECPNPVQEQPASLQVSLESSSLEYLQGKPELLPGSLELVRQKSLEEQSAFLAEGAESVQKCPIPLEESSASLEERPTSCLDSPQECQEIKCHEPLQKATSHNTKELSDRDSPEVVFVMSASQNTEEVPGNDGITDLSSLESEYVSPLEDPVSPATSVDGVDDVFILPEASSSPSGDNSLLDTTNDGSFDDLSTQETTHPGSATEDSTPSLKESGERTLCRRKAVLEPLLDLTGNAILEDDLKREIPHINGNAKALQKTLNERRLPVRASRGMRLEAIVMNINSSRYNVSGCIRTGKKSSQIADEDGKTKLCKNDTVSKVKKSKGKKIKPKASPRQGQTSASSENCKNATSNSELTSAQGKTRQVDPELPSSPIKAGPVWLKSKCSSDQAPQSGNETTQEQTDIKVDMTVASVPSMAEPLKSPKKSPSKGKAKVSAKKPRPRAKVKSKRSPQKKNKKFKGSHPSGMFSPKEPEIKLKYINYKEEKRDSRLDCFSPFIRVERKESTPSLCSVVNYPEEVRTQRKKNQQQGSSGKYASTVVPSTSCLQLGRPSTGGEHQRALVCCLCGHSANAMDLGDLHGPYYSEGYQPSAKRTTAGLKEEDSSDSDSSLCSGQGRRGRKRAAQPQWTSIKTRQWRDSSRSPTAKRPRADVEDWYSPPLLPLEPCEYWLHEDCGVWSAGVFLVKGRVYGLEEAVRAAQTTTCSACRERGATLGCFFKGCPNKYHYRCALQSDCILIEDNFSMKCKKHKNKSLKVPQNLRRDDR